MKFHLYLIYKNNLYIIYFFIYKYFFSFSFLIIYLIYNKKIIL